MKAKIKAGAEHLFSEGCSNNWENLKNQMIINFQNKYTYKSFRQKRNLLIIELTVGEVIIVFTGDIPKLIFQTFCKDQLILNII